MHLLTISAWEFRRGVMLSKRTLAFSFVLIILIASLSMLISQHGIHINNIYKVVLTDSTLYEVLQTDGRFEVYIANEQDARKLFNEGADLLIIGNNVIYHQSEKSISALDALNKAVLRYNEAKLLSYNDVNNTFPVWIKVRYLRREKTLHLLSVKKLPEVRETPEKVEKEVIEMPSRKEEVITPNKPTKKRLPTKRSKLSIPRLSTPSHFVPPIPFKSVVLSFLYIFPIYFIAHLYSSSIMEEKIKRRGELLLVSPLKSYEIVIGKLIPYLLLSLVVVTAVTLYIGKDVWVKIILTLIPIIMMYLSTAFFSAIMARSFKELSFILIFLSVCISGYIFLPAMFANIHDISYISPITPVVKLLEKESISSSEYLFSTLPFLMVSLLVFMFGIFIYREEDLFAQKSIIDKLLDSIQIFINNVPSPLFFLSLTLTPLVLLVQMILIVIMFNFPLKYGVIAFILLAAFIEEIVKSAGIYTLFSRNNISIGKALKAGILSGAGFFAGEKLLLIIVIAGISGSVFGSVIGTGLLILPLLLHLTSTSVASLSMKYLGTKHYLLSVVLATIIHSAYNLYLVRGILFA